MKHFNELLITF